jgi:hypothetical protein
MVSPRRKRRKKKKKKKKKEKERKREEDAIYAARATCGRDDILRDMRERRERKLEIMKGPVFSDNKASENDTDCIEDQNVLLKKVNKTAFDYGNESNGCGVGEF